MRSGFLLLTIVLVLGTNVCAGFRQLAFSGGGAFGAVEIGILKRIQSDKYDMYTGISAGGLNAGYLSFFGDIGDGIRHLESLYGEFRNRQIYHLLPMTGVSLLNTEPLKDTISDIIDKMPNGPVINTLIGATNLETGHLDTFNFSKLEKTDQKTMLMATSAIPVVFPPVRHMGALYADGGTLSNELLVAVYPTDGSYLNITYITPSESYFGEANITSVKDMALRTFQIVAANFNDPIATLNQECDKPVGEINKYFVASERLKGFNELDFDHGKELIDIGYQFVEKRTYKIC